ncbi:hypothetical protein Tco_0205158 [Tanacetum coccineum]
MSSPDHPTSNIEDAFPSNFLDYISASPDYVPVSPRKTYYSSSNNSLGLVPIASQTLSLFHNDPNMKVMNAYYAIKLPKILSKSCLKNYEALKKQYDDLLVKLDDTGFKAATYKRGLEEFKQPEVNEYGPRDSSLKPTIGCDKESNNSKENIDDSLEQHQKTDTETSSVKEVELKKVRENNDAPIIEDWVSDDEDDDEPNPKVEKKTVIPTATKKEIYMS